MESTKEGNGEKRRAREVRERETSVGAMKWARSESESADGEAERAMMTLHGSEDGIHNSHCP